MKELSIEEKAKAYDEAKIRGSRLWESDTITRESYEYMFPELKESEDERIRKAIITHFKVGTAYTSFYGFSKGEIINYLERQGEQKPAEYTLEQAAGIFLDALSNTPYNNKPITDAQVITKELLRFLSDACSYNPNAINEQNTAWSEEDEEKFRDVIRLVEQGASVQSIRDHYTSWLKSLKDRVQPQNTITDKELAQAKKDAYNDALNKIEYHSGEPTFDDGWSAAIWYLKKKNAQLQNTWKPSEGQLECLGYAIEKAEKDWFPLTNNRIYLTLKALKEQLLELRGNKT